MVVDIATIRDNFHNELNELIAKKDWRKILKLSENYGMEITTEVLWVFPTESSLKYLQSVLKSYSITNILSVGCGSGLLEMIMMMSLGL